MTFAAYLLLFGAISDADPSKTILNFELMAPRGKYALDSQRWARTFADLDVPVRIRTKLPGDEIEVTERARGSLRIVKAVGELKAGGVIEFPDDRTFTRSDIKELTRFIDGLKVYGAAGSPEDGPGWGLTPGGWAKLERGLGQRAGTPPLKTVAGVMGLLREASQLTVRIADDVAKYESDECVWPMAGMAAGTTAAIALESVGLGFWPVRLPSGESELVIGNFDETRAWPTGWAVPRGVAPARLIPGLFATTEMPSEPMQLDEFLNLMASTMGVALVPLTGELRTEQSEWKEQVVGEFSRPSQPILPITRELRAARLDRIYRIDDGGRPFVLIRVQDPRRQKENLVEQPPGISLLINRLTGGE